MFHSVEEYFLARHRESSFLVRLKAKTLLYFNFILAILTPLMSVLLQVLAGHSFFSLLNMVLLTITASMIVSLFILRTGNYNLAANAAVIMAMAAYSAYLLFGAKKLDIGVALSTYHLLVFVVFSALFCTIPITLGVSVIVFVISMYSLFSSELLSRAASVTAAINFGFELLVISTICYQLLRINRRTHVRLKEEADKNDQYEVIKRLIDSIRQSSRGLVQAAQEMTSHSGIFSDNAQTQASSVEEITATVEELSAGIENVAAIAKNQLSGIERLFARFAELTSSILEMDSRTGSAINLASDISSRAKKESDSLGTMSDSMEKIRDRSREMTNIVAIINDISDRINLLSLNAAIEAARAGDAGRGFAVVADEISKLADQTSSSVKDIDTLIRDSDREVERGISSVQNNVEIITLFMQGLDSIYQTIRDISESMKRQTGANDLLRLEIETVNKNSEDIRVASTEQKNAADEIVRAISVINELTQSNAAGSEEMTARAEEVMRIASKLKEQSDSEE